MKLQKCRNINFKSGLSPMVEKSVKNLDARTFERAVKKQLGIDADFNGNKAVASCFAYVTKICADASEKYKLPFYFTPPSIRLYSPENIIAEEFTKDTNGFCISTKQKILKDEGIFDTGSIFIKELPDDIKYIDTFQGFRRKTNHSSTSHFLGLFFHEWFHNIHLNILHEKFAKNKIKELDQVRILDKRMQPYNIIYKLAIKHCVSNYASSSSFELFPEVLTKLVTDSIDNETMELKHNPMDGLKEMPSIIRTFIDKELK